jgi:hypothetical protein
MLAMAVAATAVVAEVVMVGIGTQEGRGGGAQVTLSHSISFFTHLNEDHRYMIQNIIL